MHLENISSKYVGKLRGMVERNEVLNEAETEELEKVERWGHMSLKSMSAAYLGMDLTKEKDGTHWYEPLTDSMIECACPRPVLHCIY